MKLLNYIADRCSHHLLNFLVDAVIFLFFLFIKSNLNLSPKDESKWKWINRKLESDSKVFTEFIREFGVEDVGTGRGDLKLKSRFLQKSFQFMDFFSNEYRMMDPLAPLLSIRMIFFAKQVIHNACATQAILSILLNCNDPNMKLGDTLTNFKEFCHCFDPYNKGLTLTYLRIPNSHCPQFLCLFEVDSKNQKDENLFHFMGYIPIDGRLYELEGPIDLGAIEKSQNWIDVRPIIEKRMQNTASGKFILI